MTVVEKILNFKEKKTFLSCQTYEACLKGVFQFKGFTSNF